MGLRRNDKRGRGLRRAGAQFCWQNCWPNCWPNCWQKQSLNLQADEIPRRPKGSVGMTSRGEGCAGREPNLLAELLAEAIPQITNG
jgi:hypothetical protein